MTDSPRGLSVAEEGEVALLLKKTARHPAERPLTEPSVAIAPGHDEVGPELSRPCHNRLFGAAGLLQNLPAGSYAMTGEGSGHLLDDSVPVVGVLVAIATWRNTQGTHVCLIVNCGHRATTGNASSTTSGS